MNVHRSPALALAPADDGYLIYHLEREELHRCNPVAALILELCDGARSESEIIDTASALVSESEDGCREWMRAAFESGWLLTATTDAPTGPAPVPARFARAAQALREQGEVLSAYVCQEYAVSLQPGRSEYLSGLGELAHIVGRRDRAREAYEKYLELEPGDAEIRQIVTALRDDPPPVRAPDECVTQLYARFSGFYDRNMSGELDYQAPARIQEVLQRFLGEARDLDVLDLGCGTGLSGVPLRPRARTLTGVDLSRDMIDKARESGVYDELVVAEISAWLEMTTRYFDLIVACDTLIYFGDLHQVLPQAARRLRGGGWLAFTVERRQSPPYGLTDSGRYSHAREHVREVAADAGLSIMSLESGFLRTEYGDDVTGLICLLRRRS